ncbi:unnamed protein product [Miscanthus lutarioriparius]|uniref:EGF-like domain-containing protein n=1 Tax=Miscanthus lutarioriparius TaxID=422564 RepID=A0A811P374_9POAL|nr:unnamed protein product [Miscanthus lutarioriparius]
MAGVLPWLIFAATLLLAAIKSSTAFIMVAKPGCRETCGSLTTPYPFGIDPGCYHHQGFDVSCEDNHTFMHNSSSLMEIYSINLLGGQGLSSSTTPATTASLLVGPTASTSSVDESPELLDPAILQLAPLATPAGGNPPAAHPSGGSLLGGQRFGAVYTRRARPTTAPTDQAAAPVATAVAPAAPPAAPVAPAAPPAAPVNNSEVRDFNPCSYAFVAEQDWFRFEPSYLEDRKLTDKFMHGVPAVLDWVAGSEPCEEAVKNTSSYACISKNSQCMKSPNATGYLCSCLDGFAGNPYLSDGCQDINECQSPDQYPCHGICSNTMGDCSCSCVSGTHSIDPKRETCSPDASSERAELTKMFIEDILYKLVETAWFLENS